MSAPPACSDAARLRVIWPPGDDILRWVAGHLGVPPAVFRPAETLAVMRGPDLLAGVVYHEFRPLPHGATIDVSVYAARPDWLTRTVLRDLFLYPLRDCGCTRIGLTIGAGNTHAIDVARRLGWRLEGRLRRAHDGVQDQLLFGLLREECRWLAPRADPGPGTLRRGAATQTHDLHDIRTLRMSGTLRRGAAGRVVSQAGGQAGHLAAQDPAGAPHGDDAGPVLEHQPDLLR